MLTRTQAGMYAARTSSRRACASLLVWAATESRLSSPRRRLVTAAAATVRATPRRCTWARRQLPARVSACWQAEYCDPAAAADPSAPLPAAPAALNYGRRLSCRGYKRRGRCSAPPPTPPLLALQKRDLQPPPPPPPQPSAARSRRGRPSMRASLLRTGRRRRRHQQLRWGSPLPPPGEMRRTACPCSCLVPLPRRCAAAVSVASCRAAVSCGRPQTQPLLWQSHWYPFSQGRHALPSPHTSHSAAGAHAGSTSSQRSLRRRCDRLQGPQAAPSGWAHGQPQRHRRQRRVV